MTDTTAFVEVLARLLCAADVHAHGPDHPTWQQLVGEPGRRIQDDYRKAARWLAPRLTVTQAASRAGWPAVFTVAADAIDAETARLRADGVLGPDEYRPCRDAAAQLREIAAADPTPAAPAAVDGLLHLVDRAEDGRLLPGEAQPVVCVECGHPSGTHQEGEDPVTPGRCTACPDDDAWHDYHPAAARPDDTTGARPCR